MLPKWTNFDRFGRRKGNKKGEKTVLWRQYLQNATQKCIILHEVYYFARNGKFYTSTKKLRLFPAPFGGQIEYNGNIELKDCILTVENTSKTQWLKKFVLLFLFPVLAEH